MVKMLTHASSELGLGGPAGYGFSTDPIISRDNISPNALGVVNLTGQ